MLAGPHGRRPRPAVVAIRRERFWVVDELRLVLSPRVAFDTFAGEIDRHDPAAARSLAAVHPVGVEHDVLTGVTCPPFFWIAGGGPAQGRGRHDDQAVGRPRHRPSPSGYPGATTLAGSVRAGVVGA